jgi:uncharacterized protein (DUF934 family)
MALIKDDQLVDDPFADAAENDHIPERGAVIVSLEQWQDHWERLVRRNEAVGIRLKSDEHPDVIADDLDQFTVIALEFPAFRDGRAYSYARLLRDRYGYTGELRAVGDVLLEQLHFMQRVGFDAFQIDSDNPLDDYRTATNEFSTWYQPSGDDRKTAVNLRHPQAKTGQ